MRDTHTDESGRSYNLQTLEYAAHATTLAALVLTYTLQAYTVENNPGAAYLLETLGYPLTAGVALAGVALAFGLFRRVESDGVPIVYRWYSDSYPRTALAGALSLTSVGIVDVGVNLWVLAQVGVPETSSIETTLAIVGAGLLGAFAVSLAPNWSTVREYNPSLSRSVFSRETGFSIFLTLLVVLSAFGSGVGVIHFGSQEADAASTLIDGFEDGDVSEWSVNGNFGTTTDSFEGSYAGELGSPGSGFTSVDLTNFEYTSLSSMSMAYKHSGGSSTHIKLTSSADSSIVDIHANEDGDGKYDVEDADGNIQDVNLDVYAGNWTVLQFKNLDFSAGTYDFYIYDKSGNLLDSATGLQMRSGYAEKYNKISIDNSDGDSGTKVDNFKVNGASFSSPATSSVSGTVVSQTGDPISGVSVQVYAINYSHPDVSSASDKDLKARDLLENYSGAASGGTDLEDPEPQTPDAWDPELDLSSKFEDTEGRYAAVTSKGVDADYWLSDGDIGQPQLRVPADEELIVTQWNANNEPLVQGEWDSQLPGTNVQSGAVMIEQIGPGGSEISDKRVLMDETESADSFSSLDPSKLHYGSVDLNPGFYRVYPAANGESSYLIQVGSLEAAAETVISGPSTEAMSQAITPNLTAAGRGEDTTPELANMATAESEALETDKMTLKTATTNETGEFTVQLPSNLETAGVQVIGSTGEATSVDSYQNATEISEKDLRNSSIVVSGAPRIVDVPKSGVTIQAVELSAAPYEDLEDLLNKTEWREDFLENLTLSDLPPSFQDNLDSVNRSKLENLHNQMDNLTRRNDRLESRLQSVLANETDTNETINLHLNASDANRTELITRIGALQESIESLESTIEPGDGESSTDGDTLSWVKPFDTELAPENVLVRAHYTNGTTKVLGTESPYVSVNSRPAIGDEVVIEDLPLGEAAGAGIDITVATEDGVGKEDKNFRNPSYSGQFPEIESLSLSSVSPGPSETVTAELNPASAAPFDRIESVSVRTPNGSTLGTATIEGPDTVQFSTNGSGVYRVRTVFSTPNGKNHTLVQSIRASESSVDLPATVRVKTSPFGSLAVVGDGLSGGEVSIDDSGTGASITAAVPQGADAPSELEVHATDVSLPPDGTVSVRVARGPARESIGQHVETTVHLGGMSEGTLVYRNGDPLEDDSKLGSIRRAGGSSTVQTHTDDQGTLTVRRNTDPSFIDRATYFVETTVPDLGILSTGLDVLGGVGSLAGGSSSLAVGVVPIVGLVAVGKRRRS